MADLLQQAGIGDDQEFKLRVRQAIIARALAERAKPAEETTPPIRDLALDVLEQTDEWATQISRALATEAGAFELITSADQIGDTEIRLFLDSVFVAYLKDSA